MDNQTQLEILIEALDKIIEGAPTEGDGPQSARRYRREKLPMPRDYLKDLDSIATSAERTQHAYGDAIPMRAAIDEVRALRAALRPFVEAYAKAADPIGDSDLYDEQPRSVSVTLGDCRRASALLGIYPKVRP